MLHKLTYYFEEYLLCNFLKIMYGNIFSNSCTIEQCNEYRKKVLITHSFTHCKIDIHHINVLYNVNKWATEKPKNLWLLKCEFR